MRKKSLLAVAVCTAALGGASASAAFAGEVIGPPGTFTPNTAATSHANSICVFSGLNDGNPPPGIVQSYGQNVRTGDADPHLFNPGDACGPGTNPDRGTPPFK